MLAQFSNIILARSKCVEFLLASMAQKMPVFTKSGGVASEALPTITENTATLLSEAQRQDDDRDPFADDDEEKELETNELLVEDL